jgi:hypothetical protein
MVDGKSSLQVLQFMASTAATQVVKSECEKNDSEKFIKILAATK